MTYSNERISLAQNPRASRTSWCLNLVRRLRSELIRRRRPLWLAPIMVAFAIVVAMISATVPVVKAAASPIDDKKAEAARLASEVRSLGVQVEILGEELVEAEAEVQTLTDAVAEAEARLAETKASAGLVRNEVRDRAVESYIRGGDVADSRDVGAIGGDAGVAQTYVESVNGNRQDKLDELRALQLDETARREELDAAKAEATRGQQAVEQRKSEVTDLLAQRTALRNQVDGELAALIAEEQQRQAEAEAKRVREELARQQASARRNQTTPKSSGPKLVEPPPGTDVPAPNPKAAVAVATAKQQLGKPYTYGASGPDRFDCSGLTSFAWDAAGVDLPRSSRSQYSGTARVALADIQPGDLVFFGSPIHHVGIYVGGGQMINAPETGDVVKYASIYRSDLVGVGRVE